MDKITFQDYPNTTTPLNATNMNTIQTNAENAINSVSTSLNNAVTKINGKFVYSSSETVVGTWIDDTPVYRKVLYSAGINGNNVNIAHNITNLKRVLKIDVVASNDNDTSYPLNNGSSFVLQVVRITATNIEMNITTGFSSYWPVYYIIEYIKDEGE